MNSRDYNLDPPSSRSSSKLQLLDMLSIFVVLITVCIGGYFLLIFFNPNTGLNPFPPLAGNPYALPTFTITPIQLEPTWTSSPTIEPTITETPRPTFTSIASPTLFSLVPPTNTPKPTATPKAPYGATWDPIDSTIIHPEFACNWLGVGGTVVDSNNAPVVGLVIRVVGTLNGKSIGTDGSITTVSGTVLAYGQSGFEVKLGSVPLASNDTLFVQLLTLDGLPLSDNVYIDTYNDCSKNLILMRFKKNR